MFKVETRFPVAYDSPDNIIPLGAKNDNNTNLELIKQILNLQIPDIVINLIDLGCARGQFVVDCHKAGIRTVGIEGSDFNVNNIWFSSNWKDYYAFSPKHIEPILFTADLRHDYQIFFDNTPFHAHIITSWEVTEHIPPKNLKTYFNNIFKHLAIGGMFIGSISISESGPYHVSIFDEKTWRTVLLPQYLPDGFEIIDYPFTESVNDSYVKNNCAFLIAIRRNR
jgi:cyclopropane fatty-acyl-phospholipid synthase-like methyltransferase